MSGSLGRLEVLRARLRRHAEAQHARAEAAHAATLRGLEAATLPADGVVEGRRLHVHDDQMAVLWRQEAQQRAAQAACHGQLLHEVTEHKKVEKVLAARAEAAAAQAMRREAQVHEAWLRHRLHARKKGM